MRLSRPTIVKEIEAGRLYLVSAGLECFFVTISPQQEQYDYEEEIRKAVLIDA